MIEYFIETTGRKRKNTEHLIFFLSSLCLNLVENADDVFIYLYRLCSGMCSNSITSGRSGSDSEVTIPFLIRKSRVTGQLVVFILESQICLTSSVAGTSLNSSTSPSLFFGTNSIGNSMSNTNSVFGNNPRSDWKKILTQPAGF